MARYCSKNFRRRIALGHDVAGVEHQHHGRMIHLPIDFGQKLAGRADQIRLDLQAEGQVGAVADLGDLPQLIDGLRKMLARIGALGMIKGKAADQLGLEGMGQLAGLFHLAVEILFERHVSVLRPVVDVF